MEFELFIIPFTLIVVELLKRTTISNTIMPFVSVILGAIAGLGFGIYYGEDVFVQTFLGFVYGAAASGLYDLGKTTIDKASGPTNNKY